MRIFWFLIGLFFCLDLVGQYSQQKIFANDGSEGDTFGSAVSMSNNFFVVGAKGDDDKGSISGSVYIFEDQNGVWNQVSKLTANDGMAGDLFGISVSSDNNNNVVVGAFRNDEKGTDAGAAYVFNKQNNVWTQTVKLLAIDGDSGDLFGNSVSISGDWIVIGAPEDDDLGNNSGTAYVYENQNGVWNQVAKLIANDGSIEDYFGISVSIFNNYIVIGTSDDDDKGVNSGSAYIYENQNGVWNHVTKLTASDGTIDDYFGFSVDISNDYAVIGALGHDEKGADSGAAYIFENQNGVWSQVSKLLASNGSSGDYFGLSVSIFNNHVLVGADAYGNANNSGAAYIYENQNNSWSEIMKINAIDGEPEDLFGGAVSINGNSILISSSEDDDLGNNSGSAYIIDACSNYYKDADSDGYGNKDSILFFCFTPDVGYVLDSMDCNDSDSSLNLSYYYYKDLDGDGYGNLDLSIYTCDSIPLTYVDNSLDCNDSNPYIHPKIYYYEDSDSDGYGNPNTIGINGCDTTGIPPNYVGNSLDCDDSNNAITFENCKTYWVNTIDDIDDGICNELHCSLREAVNEANIDEVTSNIHFNIQGGGPHTIPITDYLLLIGDDDRIDGTTQSGNYPVKGEIIIDGTGNSFSYDLVVAGNNITINGLKMKKNDGYLIYLFSGYNGINISNNILYDAEMGVLVNSSNNKILSNYIYDTKWGIYLLNEDTIESNLISNNFLGIDLEGNEIGGQSVGIGIFTDSSEIHRNNKIYNNAIYDCTYGIYLNSDLEGINYGNCISENKIYCSDSMGISLNGTANNSKEPPEILTATNLQVLGTASPNDTIEVFTSDNSSCLSAPAQGTFFIGKTIADSIGNWILSGLNLEINAQIVAVAKNIDNSSSAFSNIADIQETYFVVNTTDDNDDGTCDSVHCSLREAIIIANNSDDTPNFIYFNIPNTNDSIEIMLTGNLPVITSNNTIIDGTSQPNYSDIGYLGINGGFNFGELNIEGNNCELYGLYIHNFKGVGLRINGDSTIIGKPNKGNLFNSNGYRNIYITSSHNVMQSNYIGTDKSGNQPLNKDFATARGITLTGTSKKNIIGGNRLLGEGNIIGGHGQEIDIMGENHVIMGNNIGVGVNDTSSLKITSGVTSGIYTTSSNNIIIGGDEEEKNLIAYKNTGVYISDGNFNVTINKNSIFCNESRGIDVRRNAIAPPTILSVNAHQITGTAIPNALVEVFIDDVEKCEDSPCQGMELINYTTANTNGEWSIECSLQVTDDEKGITATATINGKTSNFTNSEIFDNCDIFDANCSSLYSPNPRVILVVNTNSDGPGSLKSAVNCANLNPELDSIHFNIPGQGPFKFLIDSQLGLLDEGIVIDGTTQPDYMGMDYIELDGSLFSERVTQGHAIHILNRNCGIFGLYIHSYPSESIDVLNSHLGITGNRAVIGAPNKGNMLENDLRIVTDSCIVQSNYILSNVSVGDFALMGGKHSLDEGNVIEGKLLGGRNVIIKGNYFGVDKNGEKLENNSYSAIAGLSGGIIGGNEDEINTFAYKTGYGIETRSNTDVKIENNSFYCNIRGGINSLLIGEGIDTFKQAPIRLAIINDTIYGESRIGYKGVIDIYIADESCENSVCQGREHIGETISDVNGNWKIVAPVTLQGKNRITATATYLNSKTSEFSACHLVLPDICRFAEPLPVNKNACSSIGAVLDLKQLTSSTPAPTSSCATTFAGNDAWYKITVPSTGNFLVRTNISNTVVPVIEIYTECGNTALPECMVLDSLPYVMVFENYTPNDTLYLRVWDKDNGVVNSAGSALLHLTAHELAVNKDDWEICDYENLISDNPTNLIRREANSFILSYDENTPQSEIEQDSIAFTDMMEMELKKTCNCGGTPLQLWTTESPVDLDGRKKYAKSRGSVDTTNYNYIFETVEFQVNSYAIGQQHATDIAMDAEGNFAMVWKDEQRRHNYGRVYLSSGNPVSVEFPIGASEKTQYATRIAMLDNGDFITVWHEIDPTQAGATFAVYGRLFNADGTPKEAAFDISTMSANTSSDLEIKEYAKYGTNAQVGTSANGNFIVVWQVGGNVFAQRYDNNANLIGNIIEVGNTVNAGINPNPAISINTTGDFIITWTGIDNDENGIYVQRFASNGTALENAFLANTTESKNQGNPDIALSDNGSFIITWESFEQVGSGSNYDVYIQRFDASANKISSEFLVNSYTTDAQRRPSISLFDNGNFLIAWSSLGQDGYAEGIYAKLFDVNGNPIAPSFDDSDKGSLEEEFRMNTYNDPQQDKPQTASNGENIFMGAWEDGANDGSYEGIFAQRFETIEVDNTRIFYPIGTATPSTLMGDEMPYPATTYDPGSSVKKAKVAILDTGIDHTHALISNAIWNNPEVNDGDNCLIGDEIGYDFVNRVGTPIDLDGHGTQVNGILTRNFDTAIKLELINLKFHELEKGSVFDAICGIYYAVDNGVNVINLSWGFEASEEPAILKKALQYASDKDVLIVTTAGNTSKNNDRINKYPANLDIPNLIVVTAYQYKNATGEIKLANYASHGKNNVDIAAYGYVETAKRGGQKALAAGTSLAAPAVSRTAATIKGLYPVLTASEIKECILSTAESIANLANKVATGGVLDHDAALACAQTKAEMVINTACPISGLTINANVTDACGASQGMIDLSFSGNDPNPTFLWSTGDTTQNINNLSAGLYGVTITDTARCDQALSIMVTDDCDAICQTNLVMNGLDIASNIYRSDNTISSTGIIEVDSNVVFKAGESITLGVGFHAKGGSAFLAAIESCTNNLLDNPPNNSQIILKKNKDFSSQLSAKLYPNPTQDLLNIEVNKAAIGFDLELYDLMGRKLEAWHKINNQATISVNNLSAGIYFLRIDNELVKKFIVGKK